MIRWLVERVLFLCVVVSVLFMFFIPWTGQWLATSDLSNEMKMFIGLMVGGLAIGSGPVFVGLGPTICREMDQVIQKMRGDHKQKSEDTIEWYGPVQDVDAKEAILKQVEDQS